MVTASAGDCLSTATSYCLIFAQSVCLSGSDWAAWVQAVGSIIGLAIAIAVPLRTDRVRHKKEIAEKTAADKASAQLAFFKLSKMLNRVENIQRNYVSDAPDNPARCISIPAILPLDPNEPAVDVDSLKFMFPENINLLGEIAILQDRYRSLMGLINERSRFHREVIQVRLKAAALPQEFEISVADLENFLGHGNLTEISNLTDQMVDGLGRFVPEALELSSLFGACLRGYFPDLNLKVSLEELGQRFNRPPSPLGLA